VRRFFDGVGGFEEPPVIKNEPEMNPLVAFFPPQFCDFQSFAIFFIFFSNLFSEILNFFQFFQIGFCRNFFFLKGKNKRI
jgi:hypothetical protein